MVVKMKRSVIWFFPGSAGHVAKSLPQPITGCSLPLRRNSSANNAADPAFQKVSNLEPNIEPPQGFERSVSD
jgi:hypothetical protein